ncbi:MAG: NAD(P)-dependent oxidoreductase [Nitratireductor sp.]|nr:NAD(P)-dependent oxidoreductase [Nitratireductor sp.]
MSKPVVTVLGTGLMGAPMAQNLLNAGYPVRVWNRSADKALPLAGKGAEICASPAEAASKADFVITMVSDGKAVADLLFQQGVGDAMRPGTVFIDMSSIKPAEARDHAERLAETGIACLDAPVSGGTKGAEAATLAIMAGGEQEAFNRAKPVLEAMGRPVRVGPAGAGQLAKLANQAIVASTIGVVAEAMLLAEQGGANPAALRDALRGGFADSIILQQHGERMTTGNFVPGGRSAIQLKDMDNILEEAARLGLELPLSGQMQQRYRRLVEELDGADTDHSGIYLELKDRNRLS